MKLSIHLAVLIASLNTGLIFAEATSSKFSAEKLQQVEVGMPRRTVENLLGLPLRERVYKTSKEGGCPFELRYCRYTIWQKAEGPDADQINWGDGISVVDVQIFYDKATDVVAFFVVYADPDVLKYSFPGGTLGVTSFAAVKDSANQAELYWGYKTSQWWAENHRVNKERYCWLMGSAEYSKSEEEMGETEKRDELIDRSRTIVSHLLMMGNKASECDEEFLKETASTPGWISDRGDD